MIHSFLMIGQSNMAGRGYVYDVEPIYNERIKVLRNGRWQPMFVPVNPDRSFSGISLAESFAHAYSLDHDVDVGLIPCADGGTAMDQWVEGGLLYEHAIYQAKLASRTSTIAGILWHQGESDCSEALYPLYKEKLLAFMRSLRRDLDLLDVPFLVGGLGDFLKDFFPAAESENYTHINCALKEIAEENPMTGFVSAEGLTANEDNLHFNAKSLREFGMRYYAAFRLLEDKTKLFEEKPIDARSELEAL